MAEVGFTAILAWGVILGLATLTGLTARGVGERAAVPAAICAALVTKLALFQAT
jgi:hypothetical protein